MHASWTGIHIYPSLLTAEVTGQEMQQPDSESQDAFHSVF